MPEIKWLTAKCPECGREFEYVEGGYKPKTCSSFECVLNHLHPELRRKGK